MKHIRPNEMIPGRDHLTIERKFKSDKYEWSPAGFLPLKIGDPLADDLIATYARRRESIDAEFTTDLLEALGLAMLEREGLANE